MGVEIGSLETQIETSAQKINKAIDLLAENIETLAIKLSGISETEENENVVTICFKGGIKIVFPKDEVKLRFFDKDTNYKLKKLQEGEIMYVSFRGEDVLYVSSAD